jgi:hypothetical protein
MRTHGSHSSTARRLGLTFVNVSRCFGGVSATAMLLLASCAITPRVATWQAPTRFTQKEVFNAALQAGSEQSLQLAASDREAGTMAFRKKVGDGEMTLSVTIKDVTGVIQVRTIASYGGGLAIHGLHEEFIRNFHTLLFRNLGISDANERNINIVDLS